MTVTEMLQAAQYLVDASGNKQAVVLDWVVWEELLALLAGLEDAQEIEDLRQVEGEVISVAQSSLDFWDNLFDDQDWDDA